MGHRWCFATTHPFRGVCDDGRFGPFYILYGNAGFHLLGNSTSQLSQQLLLYHSNSTSFSAQKYTIICAPIYLYFYCVLLASVVSSEFIAARGPSDLPQLRYGWTTGELTNHTQLSALMSSAKHCISRRKGFQKLANAWRLQPAEFSRCQVNKITYFHPRQKSKVPREPRGVTLARKQRN